MKSEHYSNIAHELSKCIEEYNASVIFSQSMFDKNKCTEAADYLSFRGMVDGIITIGFSLFNQNVNIPSVSINSIGSAYSDCINFNISPAIFSAVDYLLKCGHTKIAYIGEPLTMLKLEILKQALHKYNISLRDEYTYISDNRFMTAGFLGARHMSDLPDPPTAIVAAYDYIALGAIEYFNSNGINVPEDISLIGMDNIIAASCSNLTSIAFDYKSMCNNMVDLLFKRIENKYYRPIQNITFDAELIIRGSVKNIK